MISALLSLLGSSAVGSVIGGVFAWLNKKNDLAVKLMEFEHERHKWANDLAVRAQDLEIVKAEAAGRKDVAIIEGDATVEAARMAAIAASQQADAVSAGEIRAAGKMGWMFVLVSVFNKSVRPLLTVAVGGTALALNWLLLMYLLESWSVMTLEQRYSAGMQALAWVTAQASMIFGYWFVSRGSSK